VVDQLLETHNSVWMSSENIAVRAHKVESRGFVGISCTAYDDNSELHRSRQSDDFVCTDLKADVTDDVDDNDVKTNDKMRVNSHSDCCSASDECWSLITSFLFVLLQGVEVFWICHVEICAQPFCRPGLIKNWGRLECWH